MRGRRRIRVGLDARFLAAPRTTGVERVAWHLVDSWGRGGSGDLEVTLFRDDRPLVRPPEKLPGPVIEVPRRARWLRPLFDSWITLQMRPAMRAHELDLFLSMNTKFPWPGTQAVTVVHGLEWSLLPEAYSPIERLKQAAWFRVAARRCAGMVTFSQSSARAIRARTSGPRRLHVVPEGVSARFHPSAAPRPTEPFERLGLGRYVLAVSSQEPRKNLARLVRAFAGSGVPADHKLVLVGREGRATRELRRAIVRSESEDRVVLAGHVDDHELLALYQHAELFAYPSLCEGFGLPVLEAMACGIPVVTSRGSATEEVAGEAAWLVDPRSEPDLRQAVKTLIEDRERAQALVQHGLERARRHSWDRMAAEIAGFLETVARP